MEGYRLMQQAGNEYQMRRIDFGEKTIGFREGLLGQMFPETA
jgi:hypothetical protein